ncbi:hypothetical protein L218DRAFT_1000214 [Marasmius fiardii PR-910]|nr:hypothetical protein L218DRAFT_1000214 [Marasmius fiardii PR-910]
MELHEDGPETGDGSPASMAIPSRGDVNIPNNAGDLAPSGSQSQPRSQHTSDDLNLNVLILRLVGVQSESPSTLISARGQIGQIEKGQARRSQIYGCVPWQKPGSPRDKSSLQSRKDLQEKKDLMERQLDLEGTVKDMKKKLRDETSRTTELSQQLEDKRHENGDLQRVNAELVEASKQDQAKIKSLDMKKKDLEMQLKKAKNELGRAQKRHTEESKECASELEKCRSELAIRMEELKNERIVIKEVRQKLEEGYEVIQQAVKTYEADQQRWASEIRALKEDKAFLEEKRNALEEDLAMEQQRIQEIQMQFKSQLQEMKQSADEMKHELDDSRRLQSEWRGRAQAGDDDLRKVKAKVHSQTAELNNIKAVLSAEHKLVQQKDQALKDATQEFADRMSALNLDLVHVNIERLVQQFRSVRSAFITREITEQQIVEACDHLGWQLVLVSDSIKDGIKPEHKVDSEFTFVSVATTSGTAFEPPGQGPLSQVIPNERADASSRSLPSSSQLPSNSNLISPTSTVHPRSSQSNPPPEAMSSFKLPLDETPTLLRVPTVNRKRLRRVVISSDSDEELAGASGSHQIFQLTLEKTILLPVSRYLNPKPLRMETDYGEL